MMTLDFLYERQGMLAVQMLYIIYIIYNILLYMICIIMYDTHTHLDSDVNNTRLASMPCLS